MGGTRNRVERTLTAAGSVSLLVLMAIVFVDVAARNLFNSPLPWGTEVLEVVLGAMVFVLYPVLALRQGRGQGHIVVDLVPVPRATRAAQRVLAGAVSAALFGVIAWACGRQALRSASYGDASAILGIPTAWVLWVVAALSALSALVFVAHAAGLLRSDGAETTGGDSAAVLYGS
ncbi:TRAP transporter small permease [Ramlibacter tataouinensis]|uniref:TRAP transporter small permease n=1 Tax=Ramlibacter tataouinensis TaxID=94132 RepID=UPI0022F3A782|nr:TRAP transporter small permease [Ramlibacter tataouinensis]WBY03054.1 TRAP transporter small permease [Ramlibacter tataouinensis]